MLVAVAADSTMRSSSSWKWRSELVTTSATPPERNTRRSSRIASGRSGTWYSMCIASVTSKVSSANGIACTSLTSNGPPPAAGSRSAASRPRSRRRRPRPGGRGSEARRDTSRCHIRCRGPSRRPAAPPGRGSHSRYRTPDVGTRRSTVARPGCRSRRTAAR